MAKNQLSTPKDYNSVPSEPKPKVRCFASPNENCFVTSNLLLEAKRTSSIHTEDTDV
jgi:hypothetical protein